MECSEAVARGCFTKKAILKNFAKLTEFFFEIFKNTFFTEHIRVTASELSMTTISHGTTFYLSNIKLGFTNLMRHSKVCNFLHSGKR